MKSGHAALAKPESLAPAAAEPRPLFVGSNIYRRAAFGNNHPLKIVRHAAVLDLVKILGWLPDSDFRTSEPATVEQTWLTTLADSPNHGPVRETIKSMAAGLVP